MNSFESILLNVQLIKADLKFALNEKGAYREYMSLALKINSSNPNAELSKNNIAFFERLEIEREKNIYLDIFSGLAGMLGCYLTTKKLTINRVKQ